MKQKWVMGNWKMHGQAGLVDHLSEGLLSYELSTATTCVVFPPAIYLPRVQALLTDSQIQWGAQNVYPQNTGALTGEISGPMLQEFGCQYVLVGHSERRHQFLESENFVAKKFHHVKEHGMIPVLCIGETLAEREAGLTEQVLMQQVLSVMTLKSEAALTKPIFDRAVIAYEPVWAIGTGQSASPDQIQTVHAMIRGLAEELQPIPLVYGGSVTAQNAAAIFSMPDVDGGLVGGASLDVKQFVEILKCIN